MFRLTQTPVGSDALVAPPRRTYLYVSGVEAEKIYLTMDKSNFQVAERRGRRSLQWVIGSRAIVPDRPTNPNLNKYLGINQYRLIDLSIYNLSRFNIPFCV